MPRVSYIDLPTELQQQFIRQTAPVTKVPNSSRRMVKRLFSRSAKRSVVDRSILPQVAELWHGLSDAERTAWEAAGYSNFYSGYQAFLQDTAYRLKNGIAGLAIPSTYHQYLCGRLGSAEPATAAKIVQAHPIEHDRMVKVAGTKSQREPQAVSELLDLPLEIGISTRANLTLEGPNPYARFYAQVLSHYKGRDIQTSLTVDIPNEPDWTAQTAVLTNVVGLARWYELIIELNDFSGTVEFDNIRAEHTGTNYARDFRCDAVGAGFDNANYQIQPPWLIFTDPEGVTLESVYPQDSSF